MKEKVQAIIDILKDRYPEAPCALHYSKDYELMIAVRLSAQCTDARVNLITPALFAAYPTLEAMASAPIRRAVISRSPKPSARVYTLARVRVSA